jgi:ubiquinone/menaquinone biosynthesis C-methylase UbiE
LTDAALLKGREVAKLLGVRIDKYVACDIMRSPFPDSSFDFVFGNSVLHHISDLDKGLSEIYRILKPDGMFFGSREPAATEVMQKLIVWTKVKSDETGWGCKEKIYSYIRWREYLERAGFSVKLLVSKNPKNKRGYPISIIVAGISQIMPDFIIKKCFASSIYIIAEKA